MDNKMDGKAAPLSHKVLQPEKLQTTRNLKNFSEFITLL